MPECCVSRTCFILAWKDRWGHLVLPAACGWALSSASAPLCFALIPDPASCRPQLQTAVPPSSGNSLSRVCVCVCVIVILPSGLGEVTLVSPLSRLSSCSAGL